MTTERSSKAAEITYRIEACDGPRFSPQRIHRLSHNFNEHPLLQLPELARLAKDLYPMGQCRFIAPGSTQASEFWHEPKDASGRDVDEVFRRIEEPGSWVALYNVETQPRYRELLRQVIDCVRPMVEPEQPGIFNAGGFIFISAPPSVTPFHIDRENNFWLQIKGRKTMNVWDPSDRLVVSSEDRARFIVSRRLTGVRLKDEFVERSNEFFVGSGDGVYFPSTSPHMTRCDAGSTRAGDAVSVSIGVVFYTDLTRMHANIHACNLFLRRFGITPSEPGDGGKMDIIKFRLGRALVYLRQRLRSYTPSVGM